jgi:hypothetical protein
MTFGAATAVLARAAVGLVQAHAPSRLADEQRHRAGRADLGQAAPQTGGEAGQRHDDRHADLGAVSAVTVDIHANDIPNRNSAATGQTSNPRASPEHWTPS